MNPTLKRCETTIGVPSKKSKNEDCLETVKAKRDTQVMLTEYSSDEETEEKNEKDFDENVVIETLPASSSKKVVCRCGKTLREFLTKRIEPPYAYYSCGVCNFWIKESEIKNTPKCSICTSIMTPVFGQTGHYQCKNPFYATQPVDKRKADITPSADRVIKITRKNVKMHVETINSSLYFCL